MTASANSTVPSRLLSTFAQKTSRTCRRPNGSSPAPLQRRPGDRAIRPTRDRREAARRARLAQRTTGLGDRRAHISTCTCFRGTARASSSGPSPRLPRRIANVGSEHSSANVIAHVEWEWLERIRCAVALSLRVTRPNGFHDIDDAGMWVSPKPVTPRGRERLDDLLSELSSAGVELRVLPSLRPTCRAVGANDAARLGNPPTERARLAV